MNTATHSDACISEFVTMEQEADHNAWLRAKVAASLADPLPAIAHAEVERRMNERLARLQQKQHQA